MIDELLAQYGIGEVVVGGEGEFDLDGARFRGSVRTGHIDACEEFPEDVRVLGGDVFIEGEGGGGLLEGKGPEVADAGGDDITAGEEGGLTEGSFAD